MLHFCAHQSGCDPRVFSASRFTRRDGICIKGFSLLARGANSTATVESTRLEASRVIGLELRPEPCLVARATSRAVWRRYRQRASSDARVARMRCKGQVSRLGWVPSTGGCVNVSRDSGMESRIEVMRSTGKAYPDDYGLHRAARTEWVVASWLPKIVCRAQRIWTTTVLLLLTWFASCWMKPVNIAALPLATLFDMRVATFKVQPDPKIP